MGSKTQVFLMSHKIFLKFSNRPKNLLFKSFSHKKFKNSKGIK